MIKCKRCRECCSAEVCQIGIDALGPHTPPCKALVFKNGEAICEVVETAYKIGPTEYLMIASRLGISAGCDSSLI